MASFSAYPPSVQHPSLSRPLDTTSAHKILSTFLHLANLDPAYRPDSTLTESGPQPTSSSGNPNLTLHHLNRIKLGLEGTNLGVEDLDKGFFGAKGTRSKEHGRKRNWKEEHNSDRDVDLLPVKAGIPKDAAMTLEEEEEEDDIAAVSVGTAQPSANGKKAANPEGWQDREDFELAQDDSDVDVNNAQRDPAMVAEMEGMGQDVMDGEASRMIDMDSDLGEEDRARGAEVRQNVRAGEKRALTREEKDERKRPKKMKSKEKILGQGQAAKGSKEPSRQMNVEGDSTTPISSRKKKKSRTNGLK